MGMHQPLLEGCRKDHLQCPLGGSVASYLMFVDVQLHIRMTHRNNDRPL